MANYAYTKIETTIKKVDYNTWLSNLTTTPDTRIIFYQELQAVNDEEEVRIKLLLEVMS
jgi:hypothetical protein